MNPPIVSRMTLALVSLVSGPLTATALPPDYGLVWSDEFNKPGLDPAKWDFGYGDWMLGPRRDATNIPAAIAVGHGNLTITTASANGRHYTGMIGTARHFQHTYGYWEARIDFDGSPGMWSAFWLQSDTMGNPVGNPAQAGMEIDVIEHRVTDGNSNIASGGYHATHWDGYGSSHKSNSSFSSNKSLHEGYHTYGLLWTPTEYRYFIDGQHVWTSTPVSKRSEYLILSSEVENGGWAGSIPARGYGNLVDSRTRMKVDYVRVYELKTTPAPSVVTFASLASPLSPDGQTAVPATYSAGQPGMVSPTWSGGWFAKRTAGPNDHTPGDDQGSAFLANSTGSVSFSSPVRVAELWMYRTTWGDAGDWTVTGTLRGATQWTFSPQEFSTWVHVLEGSALAVDRLTFTGAKFKHIDDLRVLPTIAPQRPTGLLTFSELPSTSGAAPLPRAFDAGLPTELDLTFSVGWNYRNQSSPVDDHTPNGDRTSLFADAATASIQFNRSVCIDELWTYQSDASGSGDLLVTGLLNGQVQWSIAPALHEMWQSIVAGAGIPIDELHFSGAKNHAIDDLRISLAPALPGDFDDSGQVDGNDLSQWAEHFGMTAGATLQNGDANGDGSVDGADFLAWQRNLTGSLGDTTTTTVPEPAWWRLACLSGALTLRRRTSRP